MDEVERKLAAARTKLILDKPFLGALTLRLPMKVADEGWCPTTATDAKTFYYNYDYIDALSQAQVQFVLAHEALHCALAHFARREHRVKNRWDVACDYAINPLLLADDLKPPPGILHDRHFDGMTAEEIYPLIDDNTEETPLDKHVYDPSDNNTDSDDTPPPPDERPDESDSEDESDGNQDRQEQEQDGGGAEQQEQEEPQDSGPAKQPPPLTQAEKEQLEVQWQQRLAGAAQQALQAGKLGNQMAQLVDHLLQPRLPWRSLLARYMTAVARDDFSYFRPSRREGDAIFPSLRSTQIDIVCAVDTSGSITSGELNEFISEVDAIKAQVRARVSIIACDDEIAPGSPLIFEPWEEAELPEKIHGRGATSFLPVFDWADKQLPQPDLLVYFTDAKGSFPKQPPAYPVIWLIKGKEKVPFGQRIQLN